MEIRPPTPDRQELVILAAALLGRNDRACGNLVESRGFPSHLVFHQLKQSNISCPQVLHVQDQRPTSRAPAGGELSNTTRDDVNQNVRVSNLGQRLFAKFAVHVRVRFKVTIERLKVAAATSVAIRFYDYVVARVTHA